MGSAVAVGVFCLRATLARRRGSIVSLVLVIGVLGGLSLASIAGARRTASSYPTYLASTHPSDLNFLSAIYEPGHAAVRSYGSGYDPAIIRAVERLPGVRRVESYALVNATGLNKGGGAEGVGTAIVEGSVDGEFFNQDRVTVVKGRMSNAARPGEIVVSTSFARSVLNTLKLPVSFAAGLFTNEQLASPRFGQPSVKPRVRIRASIVGVVGFNDTVVQDDVDASPFGRILLTPTLTRMALACCVSGTATYVSLRSPRDLAAVEAEIVRILPRGATPLFYVTSDFATKANQSIEPIAIALGVFGAIAGVVTLLVALLMIGRQVSRAGTEASVLRAVGASPTAIVTALILGPVCALVLGVVLAVGVALLLSPLAPLGPVRPYYPHPGVSADGLVLGLGASFLLVGLGCSTLLSASRRAPHRLARRARRPRSPLLARLAASRALPAPALTGIRYALDAGADSVPVRSAMVGVALAMGVIVATITFGASLHSLVSHPRLYGWNWDYELSSSGFGYSDIPKASLDHLLHDDRYVAAWSDVSFGELSVDGVTVPVIGVRPGARVGPPLLSGHGLAASDQVVLGAATLAALHTRVGETVTVDAGGRTVRLRVVGTATLPTVGQAGSLHTTMGTGALLDVGVLPAAQRNPFSSSVPGPQAVWIRLRPGAARAAALRSLRTIASSQALSVDGSPTVQAVQRPAQIVNYRSVGTTPDLLALGLAAGSVAALGLTLVDSVRRRRRSLAVLKALGFTRRQIAATVAWQSSMAIVVGEIVGIPLGVVAGRAAWTGFARVIHVVPSPSVSILVVVLVALGGLAVGNAVAFVPGRVAASTSTARLLRVE